MSIKTLSIMTHVIYTAQQLQLKSIARLKQIYSEIGCTVEVSDKRYKDSWISAIAEYQASKIQRVTTAPPDNQALAQAELDSYISTQAQVVAPEPLRIVEISFSDYEYYAGNQLIASISHDDNHLTQRWIVMVNDKEVFRANTLMRCDRFICTHYKDGSLPVQEQLATPPRLKTESWRISSTSARITALKFSMMGFIPTILKTANYANWVKSDALTVTGG